MQDKNGVDFGNVIGAFSVSNGDLKAMYVQSMEKDIVKALTLLSSSFAKKIDENSIDNDLRNKEAFIELTESDGNVFVSVAGDPEGVFLLANMVAGTISKERSRDGKISDNLLDKVSISFEWAVKYEKWLESIAEEIAGKVDPGDIGEDGATVDKDGNLVISVRVGDKEYQFKIPESGWKF